MSPIMNQCHVNQIAECFSVSREQTLSEKSGQLERRIFKCTAAAFSVTSQLTGTQTWWVSERHWGGNKPQRSESQTWSTQVSLSTPLCPPRPPFLCSHWFTYLLIANLLTCSSFCLSSIPAQLIFSFLKTEMGSSSSCCVIYERKGEKSRGSQEKKKSTNPQKSL